MRISVPPRTRRPCRPREAPMSGLMRLYRQLPLGVRDRLRWIRFPAHYATVGALWRSSGGRVLSGPFKGMLWRKRNPHMAYLLGTQELELAPAVESLIGAGFRDLINVG